MTNSFSVSLCTYNGAKFLPEQLASIASQTRLPDELIICDDRSTDSTLQIIERFGNEVPFPVELHINNATLGSTKNFEKAAQLCNGDLIAFADQDDVWFPQKLERLETEFRRNENVGLVFTDAELVDESLQPLGSRLWEALGFDESMKRRVTSGRRALEVLLPGWTVTGATMAFRSKFRSIALGIPEDLAMIHDGWIALVVASVADIALIDEPLIKYRQHPGQQIGAPAKKQARDEIAVNKLDAVRAGLHRVNSFDELIEIGERLRQRLAERQNEFDTTAALIELDSRLAHMKTRGRLDKSRLKRIQPVLGELLALRYHRYSNGIYSAAKDLLR